MNFYRFFSILFVRRIASTLFLLFAFDVACVSLVHSQMREKKHITMPSGSVLYVEVAKDAVHRALGLMYRKNLPKDNGMLFVFRDEKIRTFWMKDTRIPLSIAFLNKKGIAVKIADMRPFSTEALSSDVPCQYVIEVNKGYFSQHAFFVGMRLALPHVVAYE